MNAIETVTGAVVSGIWKLAAVVLLIALVLTGVGMGAGWYLAARDRDAKQVELVAERDRSAQLAASVVRQNEAVASLEVAKSGAEARGQAAQRLAAANGKRFDQALAHAAGAKAMNCADAMPVVEMVREAVQ